MKHEVTTNEREMLEAASIAQIPTDGAAKVLADTVGALLAIEHRHRLEARRDGIFDELGARIELADHKLNELS